MTVPVQRIHDAIAGAGITSQMLRDLAAVAKFEACARMSATTLGTPAADAIGARYWLETTAERMDAFQLLEQNADLFKSPAALELSKADVGNKAIDPVQRAKEIVEYKRAGGFSD